MFKKFRDRISGAGLGMRPKLLLSLGAIAVVLLTSCIISIFEYSRMSRYVSTLIAGDISSIGMAHKLADVSAQYNLDILSAIGNESVSRVPDFDQNAFMGSCDTLRQALASMQKQPLADSVVYAYSAYMLTSLELPQVMQSDFVDSKQWYVERLQPRYNKLSGYVNELISTIYEDLRANSLRFDRGFYRSVMPGLVAVGVGLFMLMMLLFFLMTYYVNPLCKMRRGLKDYRAVNKKYDVSFTGDDELSDLNLAIRQLAEENRQLGKRVKDMREKLSSRNNAEAQ